MLKNITIGQYIPGESMIHVLDPRIKIILTVFFITITFLINNFWGYILIALFTLFIIIIAKIPLKYILRGLKPLFWIIIFTFVLNLFMTKGEPIFKFYFLVITSEGLRLSIFMSLRIIFLVLTTSLLTLTTSPIILTDGIEKLLKPFKKIGVPAHEFAMMMTIALRFIPTLLEETEKIIKAQMARGADFESGNIFNRAKSMIPILVPLFVSAFRRADDLAMAMEARCYRGGDNRSRMKQLHLHLKDYIILCSSSIIMGFIIYIGRL